MNQSALKKRADDFQSMPWATEPLTFSKAGLSGASLKNLFEVVDEFGSTLTDQEKDRPVLQKALETLLDRRKSVHDMAALLLGGEHEMSYQVHFSFEQALKSAGISAYTDVDKVAPETYSMTLIVDGVGIRITNFDRTKSGALRVRFDEVRDGAVGEEILMGDRAFAPVKAAFRRFIK